MSPPLPILTTAGVRALEARHLPQTPLMERAGAAVADTAARMLGNRGGIPLIVAGPGNNGGDGFVAARLLQERGFAPQVVFLGDAEKLPADARTAYEAWQAAGGKVQKTVPGEPFALVVDAIFGIGLGRPAEGEYANAIKAINALGAPVLAVDIPSGLASDTGCRLGPAVYAHRTVSFFAAKPGLLTHDGPDCCGEVQVADLGIPIGTPEGQTVSPDLFDRRLRPRPRNSHKGSYGSVGILGGAAGMAGAALLAGRAALLLGAGRIYVGMLERLAVDPLQPELMLREAGDIFINATAIAIGPGLGQDRQACALLRQSIDAPQPLVVDADALNLMAAHPVLLGALGRRAGATLLTPHPAEAARLLTTTVDIVQADRLAAARELARRTNALVALKGCGTVIAVPEGPWFINGSGNPGLSTAGSGDVLTGFIAALLAQGWPGLDALLCAVHLHGAAADALAAQGIGPVGLTAGELAPAARRLFNDWIAARA